MVSLSLEAVSIRLTRTGPTQVLLKLPLLCARCLVVGSWGSNIPLVVGAWGSNIPLVVGSWGYNIPLVVGAWGSNIPIVDTFCQI